MLTDFTPQLTMYTVKFSFTVFDQFTLVPWNNQYHTVFRIIF